LEPAAAFFPFAAAFPVVASTCLSLPAPPTARSSEGIGYVLHHLEPKFRATLKNLQHLLEKIFSAQVMYKLGFTSPLLLYIIY
jgi:hypothetical protein